MKDFSKLLKNDLRNELIIDDITINNDGKSYSLDSFKMNIIPILSAGFLPKKVDSSILIKGILGEENDNFITDTLSVTFKNNILARKDFSLDALIKDLNIHNNLKIANLILSDSLLYIQNNNFSSVVDLNSELKLNNGKVNIDNDFIVKDFTFKLDSLKNIILDNPEKITNKIHADFNKFDFDNKDNKRNSIILDSLLITLDDFLNFHIFDFSFDVSNSTIDLGKTKFGIDLFKAKNHYNKVFTEIFNIDLDVTGNVNSTTTGKINILDEPKFDINTDFNLIIDSLCFNDSIVEFTGFKLNENISFKPNNDLFISSDLSLSTIDFNRNSLSKFPEINDIGLHLKNELSIYKDFKEININCFDLSLSNLQNELKVLDGKVILNNKSEADISLKVVNKLNLLPSYSFSNNIDSISGCFIDTILINLDTNKVLAVDQNILFEKFNLNLYLDSLRTQNIFLSNMNSNIPISFKVDLKKMLLLEEDGNNNYNVEEKDFYKYMNLRDQYKLSNIPVSNLSIDKLSINHSLLKTEFGNFEADIYFKNNKFNFNRYYFELFDGNLTGNLICDIKNGKLDESISERINILSYLVVSGINTEYFSHVLERNDLENSHESSSSSDLNFTANLEIDGVKNIITKPQISGDVSITRISDDDVSYLLDFLNKGAKDQSISMLQNVLNMFPGIKVNLISFKLKNNFIYTLINLHKPWYLFYFPLGEDIRLSKQSLKFYLDKYVGEE